MSGPRIWNLRINLDEFNAAFLALDDDTEKSHFLTGLSRGMNGGAPKEGGSPALQAGFDLGIESRGEAESYRARKVLAGERSAEVRLEKHGTAQPSRTVPEQCSNGVRESLEPIPNPQSLILNPESPLGPGQEGTSSLSGTRTRGPARR